MAGAFDLMSTCARLRDDGTAVVTEGGDAFWSTLASRPAPRRGPGTGRTGRCIPRATRS